MTRLRLLAGLTLASHALNSPTPASGQLPDTLRTLFDYPADAPLLVADSTVSTGPGVRILDVDWASPIGGRARAFLVIPSGPGPFPAVLYVHLGQGDRGTFLDEALTLAGMGAASLLIDAPFNRPEPDQADLDPHDPTAGLVQLVVDVRRGVDLLAARPDIDPSRLAYVGHSLGATAGGVLVAVEDRLKAAVLMAGFASQSRWFEESDHPIAADARQRLAPDRFQAQVRMLRRLDAVYYLPHSVPRLLFQFARNDEYISEDDARTSMNVAPESSRALWYDTDHFFNERARQDRLAWLVRQLNLSR